MDQLFATLGHWTWIVLAAILFGLEIFVPGTFLLWFGFAALAIGLIAWVLPIAPIWQVLLFALLALVAFFGWRRFGQRRDVSDAPYLNRRADAFIGQRFLLAEPIVGGEGRVRIADSTWRVRGPDTPAGQSVTVTGVDGSVLVVAQAP